MSGKELFPEYPRRIRAATKQPGRYYTRLPGYAIHNRPPGEPAPGAEFLLEDGAIAVYRSQTVPDELHSASLGPIYGLEPHGPPAVPTGRVFIRFAEQVRVASRVQELLEAGYVVDQFLPYAAHAAWLLPSSAAIADALTRIPALEAIPDVENVEPQMLQPPSRRC